MKNSKFIRTMLILAVIAVLPLAAQVSNTTKITGFMFRNDIDNFLTTTNYGSVSFDNGFFYLGLDKNYILELGHATRIENIYLGLGYVTNLLASNIGQYNDADFYRYYDQPYFSHSTDKVILKDVFYGKNDLSVLIGFKNMGVKVGLYQEGDLLQRLSEPQAEKVIGATIVTTITEALGGYDETTIAGIAGVGDIATAALTPVQSLVKPFAEFGMSFGSDKLLIKPRFGLAVGFDKEEFKHIQEVNETDLNGNFINNQIKTTIATADSKIGLNPYLASDFIFQKESGNNFVFGLKYMFGYDLYNSAYVDEDGYDRTFKGKTEWFHVIDTDLTANTVDNTFDAINTGKSYMLNSLSFYAKQIYHLSERIGIGFGGSFVASYENYGEVYSTYEVSGGTATDTEIGTMDLGTVSVNPMILFGLQYKLIPAKLLINAGVDATVPAYNLIMLNNDGTEVAPRTKWGKGGFDINTGFTWHITEKAFFDAGFYTTINMNSLVEWSLLTKGMDLKFVLRY